MCLLSVSSFAGQYCLRDFSSHVETIVSKEDSFLFHFFFCKQFLLFQSSWKRATALFIGLFVYKFIFLFILKVPLAEGELYAESVHHTQRELILYVTTITLLCLMTHFPTF